ncbi:AtpZ/AtpI family protein [Singulisphaera rosea]
MDDEPNSNQASRESNFGRQIGAQAARKVKSRRGADRSVWFGLGMSGLIGWSVVVPTLGGAALGIWVDTHFPSSYSWTLMLLLVGLILGCLNAWHWVNSESKAMQEEGDE